MPTGILEKKDNKEDICQRFAPDVACVTVMIANICLVGPKGAKDGEWTLIDAGVANSADKILNSAEEYFGGKSKPNAIVLTHGHFDHIGAIIELADHWQVQIYAHKEELPYLTGQTDYPQPDPSVGGGLMAAISPLYPNKGIDLGSRVKALPEDGSIPPMTEWKYIHTPGHTPGHISLFREKDRVLIAGDAFTTVKQESAMAVLLQKKEIHGPPSYFTIDWSKAKQSVRKLEDLDPSFVITGHGQPMCGEELRQQLEELAKDFDSMAVPEQGRYVNK